MPRNWLAAIFLFPAVVLDEAVEFIKRIFKDEEEVLKGSEDNDDE